MLMEKRRASTQTLPWLWKLYRRLRQKLEMLAKKKASALEGQ